MKKVYFIFIIMVVGLICLTSIISVVSADTLGEIENCKQSHLQMGNVSVDIPSAYQRGRWVNYSDASIYDIADDSSNVFRITVHNDSKYFVDMVGFDIDSGNCNKLEETNIGGHPCYVCYSYNNYMKNYTVYIFESNGSMVRLYIPHSTSISPEAESIISSTPPSLFSADTLHNTINESVEIYKQDKQEEYALDDAYDEGYDEGYGYSESTWTRNIPIIGSWMSN